MNEVINIGDRFKELEEQIRELQLRGPTTPGLQDQILRLQTQLYELRRRGWMPRPRMLTVAPSAAPPSNLTPSELVIWETFADFHAALLAYAGEENRQAWLQLLDVAADMNNALYGGGGGGGTGTAPTTGVYGLTGSVFVPVVPLTGVTNGSNAPAGDVGEVITAGPIGGVTMPIYEKTTNALLAPWDVITSVPLSAGDWNVTGIAQIQGPLSPPQQDSFYTHALFNTGTTASSPMASMANGWVYSIQPPISDVSLTLGVARFNLTVATTVYLIGSLQDVAGNDVGKNGTGAGYIIARRMR
jgi:hypothetical protein